MKWESSREEVFPAAIEKFGCLCERRAPVALKNMETVGCLEQKAIDKASDGWYNDTSKREALSLEKRFLYAPPLLSSIREKGAFS